MLMEFATTSVSSSRVYFSPYLFAMRRHYRGGRIICRFWAGLERGKHLQAEVLAEAGDAAGGLDVAPIGGPRCGDRRSADAGLTQPGSLSAGRASPGCAGALRPWIVLVFAATMWLTPRRTLVCSLAFSNP